MNESQIPPTLSEAIATEPWWLLAWLMLLGVAQLGAIAFAAGRENGNWFIRPECFAIVPGFILAGILMNWMYGEFGYVRLLGLAHIIGWTLPFFWVISRLPEIGTESLYGKYIRFYLGITGTSLVIDALDVIRYALGDGELYLRWSML